METIHIPRVADLPDAARAERELLQAQDIVSLVVLPLVYGGQAVGFVGFDTVREQKSWSEESIRLLRIVGEIFVNAIERKKAVDALQQAYQTLEQRVQDRTRELYTLLSVQQAISSRVDPEAMLQMIADEARRGELHQARPGDLRIDRPLEAREVLDVDEAGLLQPSREEPIGPPRQLVLDEQIEEVQVCERRGGRLLEPEGERFGHAGEAEMAKTGRQLGIHESGSRV
mgnify:CR=1 FL=1